MPKTSCPSARGCSRHSRAQRMVRSTASLCSLAGASCGGHRRRPSRCPNREHAGFPSPLFGPRNSGVPSRCKRNSTPCGLIFRILVRLKTHDISAAVEFRSHLDGSPLFLGPKEAMEMQVCWDRTSRWRSTNAQPHDAMAEEQQLAVNAPSAGRANAASSPARRANWFSASCRAAATPRCVRNARRRWSRWNLTVTRSAA